jgi:hypothetical protein
MQFRSDHHTLPTPAAIVSADAMKALRDAGWIIVRNDAIALAQAMEREACRWEAAQKRAA